MENKVKKSISVIPNLPVKLPAVKVISVILIVCAFFPLIFFPIHFFHTLKTSQGFGLGEMLIVASSIAVIGFAIIMRRNAENIHKLNPILEFDKPECNTGNNSLEVGFHFENKADVLVLDGLITIKCHGRTIVSSAKFNISSLEKGLNFASQNFPMADFLSENSSIDSFEILVIITHFELKFGSSSFKV
jgi:hypothetical protein